MRAIRRKSAENDIAMAAILALADPPWRRFWVRTEKRETDPRARYSIRRKTV